MTAKFRSNMRNFANLNEGTVFQEADFSMITITFYEVPMIPKITYSPEMKIRSIKIFLGSNFSKNRSFR